MDRKEGRTLMAQLLGALAEFLAQAVNPVAGWAKKGKRSRRGRRRGGTPGSGAAS